MNNLIKLSQFNLGGLGGMSTPSVPSTSPNTMPNTMPMASPTDIDEALKNKINGPLDSVAKIVYDADVTEMIENSATEPSEIALIIWTTYGGYKTGHKADPRKVGKRDEEPMPIEEFKKEFKRTKNKRWERLPKGKTIADITNIEELTKVVNGIVLGTIQKAKQQSAPQSGGSGGMLPGLAFNYKKIIRIAKKLYEKSDIYSLIKLANYLEHKKLYRFADSVDRLADQLANEGMVKIIENNGQIVYIFTLGYEYKDIAKRAGFRYDPVYKRWYTYDWNIAVKLDPNLPKPSNVSSNIMPDIIIQQIGNKYVIRGNTYPIKDLLKELGARFDGTYKYWYFTNPTAELLDLLDDPIKFIEHIEKMKQQKEKSLQLSYAHQEEQIPTDITLISPLTTGKSDKDYFPYQKIGIHYALDRPSTLIADDMGLGKTIQAIGVINNDPSLNKILIVVPKIALFVWVKELKEWLVRNLTIGIAEDPKKELPNTNIVLMKYTMLDKFYDKIRQVNWDLVIGDEAHLIKNTTAKRTQALLGRIDTRTKQHVNPVPSKKRILLTGTPIENNPEELWALLHFLDPQQYPNKKRFINSLAIWSTVDIGYKTVSKIIGWDENKLKELAIKLREKYMVRRLKEDVLKELPPKITQVIELETDDISVKELLRQEQQIIEEVTKNLEEQIKNTTNQKELEALFDKLNNAIRARFEDIARIRHELGLSKVPQVVEHILNILEEDPNRKIVVFAHHQDVVQQIKEGIEEVHPNSTVIVTGQTNEKNRQLAVDLFQNDPKIKVFIGNIQAAGVAITLTASSTAIFAELDWTPSKLKQAEDRIRRIGQTKPVLVQYLVYNNSLDARISELLIQKINLFNKLMQDQGVQDEKDTESETEITDMDSKTENINDIQDNITQRNISRLPNEDTQNIEISTPSPREEILTPEQIEAIHMALRDINENNSDAATQKNYIGFNKLDSRIGKDLAERPFLTPRQALLGKKILTKYRYTQVDPELAAIIWPSTKTTNDDINNRTSLYKCKFIRL